MIPLLLRVGRVDPAHPAEQTAADCGGAGPVGGNRQTSGDADQTSKLLAHGGKGGAFVAEIRRAVLASELNAAMPSLKDMPGNEDTPGLVIGATLSRDLTVPLFHLAGG